MPVTRRRSIDDIGVPRPSPSNCRIRYTIRPRRPSSPPAALGSEGRVSGERTGLRSTARRALRRAARRGRPAAGATTAGPTSTVSSGPGAPGRSRRPGPARRPIPIRTSATACAPCSWPTIERDGIGVTACQRSGARPRRQRRPGRQDAGRPQRAGRYGGRSPRRRPDGVHGGRARPLRRLGRQHRRAPRRHAVPGQALDRAGAAGAGRLGCEPGPAPPGVRQQPASARRPRSRRAARPTCWPTWTRRRPTADVRCSRRPRSSATTSRPSTPVDAFVDQQRDRPHRRSRSEPRPTRHALQQSAPVLDQVEQRVGDLQQSLQRDCTARRSRPLRPDAMLEPARP